MKYDNFEKLNMTSTAQTLTGAAREAVLRWRFFALIDGGGCVNSSRPPRFSIIQDA